MKSQPRPYRFEDTELVITTPTLFRPWFHYLSGETYGLRFSQTGGGFSVHPILEGRRITRYSEADPGGRAVYCRDRESGETWALNYRPVLKALDEYECRHGLGYSEIRSAYRGIAHSFRVVVLPEDPGELWTITLTNRDARPRRLTVFPFVDWLLGDSRVAWDDPVWYTRAEAFPEAGLIVASFFDPAQPGTAYHAFLKAFFAPDGWCCSKRRFCGFQGSLQAPEGLAARSLRVGFTQGEGAIGCFRRHLELQPGASVVLELLLGQAGSALSAKPFDAAYRTAPQRRSAYARVDRYWKQVVARHAVRTPDPVFDRWINIWLKYQEHQCFRWAGLGDPNAPLMGYRDVLQHTLAMSLFAPELARSRIAEALRHQYPDGRAVRQWSRRGAHDRRDYRDSPVWIVFALCDYLKETHDFGFLEEKIPYLDTDRAETVLDHARRALEALYGDRGGHGLSHIGEGDWYDPLNKVGIRGRGESVWLSMALVAALREMAALQRHRGFPEEAETCRGQADALSACINEHGWDGAWYRYAYDDDGHAIGTRRASEGRIFANPQIWAVLSGVATAERRVKCLAALDRHLRTPFGYAILTPPFSLKHRAYGNVGILQSRSRAYAHVSAFKMVCDCLCGRGDEALETFKRILPDNPAHPPEATLAEPHIIPNGYAGVSADPLEGVVLHSGSSGAFPWILKAVIGHLFGARADYEGLSIRPCLPRAWREASINRHFRGSLYRIRIEQLPPSAADRRATVLLDGVPLKGETIPPDRVPSEHEVLVRCPAPADAPADG